MSMTTSPATVRAATSAATTLSGGGGARRSKTGSCGPRFGRMSDERGSAMCFGVYGPTAQRIGRTKKSGGPFGPPRRCQPGEELLLVFVVVVDGLFIDKRLVCREVVRHDAADVLDLVVFLVELELVLEVHLFADERAFGVRPQVADLGRRRKRDFAVVGRILVRLANDDADVALADRCDARGVLVAVREKLQQPSGDARLDVADVQAVRLCLQPRPFGCQLD